MDEDNGGFFLLKTRPWFLFLDSLQWQSYCKEGWYSGNSEVTEQ